MIIREVIKADLDGLLSLYEQLHNNPFPSLTADLVKIWENILADKNHHIIVLMEDGLIISSCVVVIVPNLTNSQRPYALIENVITHEKYRKKGYASRCLELASDIAKQNGCYKIMLMTGSKDDSTLRFYEKSGYNRADKTAFIQWL